MNLWAKLICISALLLSVFAVPALCEGDTGEIEITVAPNTLNIASQAVIVTVHTDIAYSLVVGSSVKLNGLDIDWWKSDNQGNFVAKFDSDAVKGIVDPGTAILTLAGTTTAGDSFFGTDTIEIVDVTGKK